MVSGSLENSASRPGDGSSAGSGIVMGESNMLFENGGAGISCTGDVCARSSGYSSRNGSIENGGDYQAFLLAVFFVKNCEADKLFNFKCYFSPYNFELGRRGPYGAMSSHFFLPPKRMRACLGFAD